MLNLYAKISTNVQQTTVDVVLTLTASIQMEALAADAETVTMETDFSAVVKLSPFCTTVSIPDNANNNA